MSNRIFYSWINPKFDLTILIVLAICTGISSGISPQIGTYMVSALSTNPADAAMCNYVYFAGMTVAFALIERLRSFFSIRQLLTAICMGLLFCNAILATTDSSALIILLTFFVGVFRIMGAILIIVTMTPILMPQGQRYLLYCVYFPITLLLSPLGGLAMATISDKVNWRFSFHFCNLLLFVGLIVVLLTVHNERPAKRLALWKFDWFSHFLIAGWMISFVYILVYGRMYDWFDSQKVTIAFVTFIVCIVTLLIRNSFQRTPLLTFEIFKMRNVRIGMILIFMFGAFFTLTNTLDSLMTLAFHTNPVQNAKVNTFPVVGYVIGTVIAYFYFKKFNNFKIMILATIIFYWLSSIMLYFLVDSQVEVSQLFLPMVLRGIAIIFSYISIGLYVTTEVPRHFLPHIPFFLIFFRSFLGPTIWGNFYSNWLVIRQVQLMDKLAGWSVSDQSDPLFHERFQSINGHGLDMSKNVWRISSTSCFVFFKRIVGLSLFGGYYFLYLCAVFAYLQKVGS